MSAITEQPTRALAVAPSNLQDLPIPSGVGAILFVGTSGQINCITEGGDNVLFQNVPSGTILPVKIKRVISTGTNAQGIIALF
jgi:hypothetical protein